MLPLIAGGIAGFTTDVALFPLDTLKTRMQSREGFLRAGAFKGVYAGLGPAAVGSFPGAALFFHSYEWMKQQGYSHMASSSVAEVVACIVRVPTENVKQNLQANRFASVGAAFGHLVRTRGFYNGYLTTIAREIPFSAVQFPLWEHGKVLIARAQQRPCSPLESAACGSLAGGFAAAITTPIDVVKTRLMTSPDKYNAGMLRAFATMHAEEGFAVFASGIKPRVMWISIGGFVFLGSYEMSIKLLFYRCTSTSTTACSARP